MQLCSNNIFLFNLWWSNIRSYLYLKAIIGYWGAVTFVSGQGLSAWCCVRGIVGGFFSLFWHCIGLSFCVFTHWSLITESLILTCFQYYYFVMMLAWGVGHCSWACRFCFGIGSVGLWGVAVVWLALVGLEFVLDWPDLCASWGVLTFGSACVTTQLHRVLCSVGMCGFNRLGFFMCVWIFVSLVWICGLSLLVGL